MFCKNCGNQIKVGSKFCGNCGQETSIRRVAVLKDIFFGYLNRHRKLFLIGLGATLLVVIVGAYVKFSSIGSNSQYSAGQVYFNNLYDQSEVVSSVVNIFCPSTEGEKGSGGSGVILTEDGMVLTNSHIIPQDEENILTEEGGCLVVLPDPTTGQVKDIYLANPIVIPDLSDKYDLAYMQIYAAYYDDEEGEYVSVYPTKFPAFDDSERCRNESVQLGEPVRIFGYPAISGGYSLTITDGVVSSFPGEGLIVTSAKISHGSSGGLAVDKYGCMIGIPFMFSSDEAESLGVLISMDLVNEFSEEVLAIINSEE